MPEGAARRNLGGDEIYDENLWQGAVNGMYFLPLTAKGAVFVEERRPKDSIGYSFPSKMPLKRMVLEDDSAMT